MNDLFVGHAASSPTKSGWHAGACCGIVGSTARHISAPQAFSRVSAARITIQSLQHTLRCIAASAAARRRQSPAAPARLSVSAGLIHRNACALPARVSCVPPLGRRSCRSRRRHRSCLAAVAPRFTGVLLHWLSLQVHTPTRGGS